MYLFQWFRKKEFSFPGFRLNQHWSYACPLNTFLWLKTNYKQYCMGWMARPLVGGGCRVCDTEGMNFGKTKKKKKKKKNVKCKKVCRTETMSSNWKILRLKYQWDWSTSDSWVKWSSDKLSQEEVNAGFVIWEEIGLRCPALNTLLRSLMVFVSWTTWQKSAYRTWISLVLRRLYKTGNGRNWGRIRSCSWCYLAGSRLNMKFHVSPNWKAYMVRF